MSIFIDTGVFIAYSNKRDTHHGVASTIMENIMKNKYGLVFTSDLVFSEAVTFVLYKIGDIRKVVSVRDLIFGNEERSIPRFINFLFMDETILEGAWNIIVKYADKKLSFTDCSIIELMRQKKIEQIASFDSDFDGIVPRLAY